MQLKVNVIVIDENLNYLYAREIDFESVSERVARFDHIFFFPLFTVYLKSADSEA